MGARMTALATPIDWPAMMGEVAVALLGEPNAALSNRCTLRYRRRGSLALHIAGPYAGRFHDYEAGESGGVLDLIRRERGGDRRDAMAWLQAHGVLSGERVPAREHAPRAVSTRCTDAHPTKDTRAFAYRIWRAARPLRGSLAEAYLHGRGTAVAQVADAPALRFHPRLRHPVEPGVFPCLVAGVQDSAGRFIGIQRTYLEGPHKARVEPVRASLGRLTGGAVRLAEAAGGVLLLGEGIESTAAAMAWLQTPGWAVLGTAALRALALPEAIREVVIAADRDAPGLNAPAALAERFETEGRRVTICTPCVGGDFADSEHGR